MYAQVAIALCRRRRDFVRARYTGAQTIDDNHKVVVFAHYNRKGCVHDSVLYYMDALRDAGYVIVFVSNSPQLAEVALSNVLPRVALVLHRWNVGYDFGAYRDGLLALGDLTRFDQVLLANDSVYGPLFDLGGTLARCDDGADIWSTTDSYDRGYHLQSYFLLFRRPALGNPDLMAFWRAVWPVNSRDWVIRRYEIGFTRAMRRAGLRCAALFPYDQAVTLFKERALGGTTGAYDGSAEPYRVFAAKTLDAIARGQPCNAMHHFWDLLVVEMQCPFIKRELLVYNPLQVPGVCQWRDVVNHVSGYNTDLIVRQSRDLGRAIDHANQGPSCPC
jgi:hypothetical protein